MRKKAIVLATVCVMIVVTVFFEFYVFRTQQTTLTVQARNDASITFGIVKWMFLYDPSYGTSYEVHYNFPFPFFPMVPGSLTEFAGKPILFVVSQNASQNYQTGFVMNATSGYSLGNLLVASANRFSVTLVFKHPLS
jgi:uncharacterized membrane-anchored protein YjiN (DUF445 family)